MAKNVYEIKKSDIKVTQIPKPIKNIAKTLLGTHSYMIMQNSRREKASKYINEKYNKILSKRQEIITKDKERKGRILIDKFMSDWECLMVNLGIKNKAEQLITPFNCKVLDNGETIVGKLIFPIGLSISNIDGIKEKIQQGILGGCNIVITNDYNSQVIDFSVTKKWHDLHFIKPITKKIEDGKEVNIEFGDLFYGHDVFSNPVFINIFKSPHSTIFGGTGSGKTKMLDALITNLALTHNPDLVHLYFLQVSKNDYVKFEDLKHCKACVLPDDKNTLDCFKEINNVLDGIEKQINERVMIMKPFIKENDDANILLYNKTVKDKLPILIAFTDEAGDIYEAASNKEVQKIKNEVIERTSRLAKAGRSVGIFIFNVLQKATKDQIPTIIKNNSMLKVSFSQPTSSGSLSAIEDAYGAFALPKRVAAYRNFASASGIGYFKVPTVMWTICKKLLLDANLLTSNNKKDIVLSKVPIDNVVEEYTNTFIKSKMIIGLETLQEEADREGVKIDYIKVEEEKFESKILEETFTHKIQEKKIEIDNHKDIKSLEDKISSLEKIIVSLQQSAVAVTKSVEIVEDKALNKNIPGYVPWTPSKQEVEQMKSKRKVN